jgi:hypothetical protein
MQWMRGGANRQCDRTLGATREALLAGGGPTAPSSAAAFSLSGAKAQAEGPRAPKQGGFTVITPERELTLRVAAATDDAGSWVAMINSVASWGGQRLPM